MSENSRIAWTDHTFNGWWGCTHAGAGCQDCYAEREARRRLSWVQLWGRGSVRLVNRDRYWDGPLKWNTAAQKAGVRRRVFCQSMGDVFEDYGGPVLDHANRTSVWSLTTLRERLWGLIAQTPQLDWLLLTKRPQNVEGMVPWSDWPTNVWLGASASTRRELGPVIGDLTLIPARVRFISFEPLLESCRISLCDDGGWWRYGIDWLIIGGESGPGGRAGRPCDNAWISELIAQADRSRIPIFVKQIHARGRVVRDVERFPEELRRQELPLACGLEGVRTE